MEIHQAKRDEVYPHLDIEKMIRFMLNDENLTDEEGGHVIRCDKCMCAMVEGTIAKLHEQSLKEEADPEEPHESEI